MATANVVIGSRMLVAAAVVTTMCLILLAGAPGAAAGITCGQVAGALGPCIPYIRNAGALTSNCCAGVRNLNAAARTTADRQAACVCLKSIGSHIPGLNPALAAGLPGKCGVNVGFPISFSIDCSKIH